MHAYYQSCIMHSLVRRPCSGVALNPCSGLALNIQNKLEMMGDSKEGNDRRVRICIYRVTIIVSLL